MSKVKDIAITSVGVSYIVPTSPRSVDAKLMLGIDNPARKFAVNHISGVIRYQGKDLAHFITGGMELEGNAEQVYALPCTVTLADGVSILEVLVIASKGSLTGLTADVDIQASGKTVFCVPRTILETWIFPNLPSKNEKVTPYSVALPRGNRCRPGTGYHPRSPRRFHPGRKGHSFRNGARRHGGPDHSGPSSPAELRAGQCRKAHFRLPYPCFLRQRTAGPRQKRSH